MTGKAHTFEASAQYRALVHDYAHAATEALAETLWPTRCALCDMPGTLLCDECQRALAFIDFWRACPLCGAPHGSVQCSECNPIALKTLARKKLPFSACVCTAAFTPTTARLITTYKDRGEVRLAQSIAHMMAQVIPPRWPIELEAITVIPASANALRRRGFDHARLLADALADALNMPVVPTLARPRSKDQRGLSKSERAQNMKERFQVNAALHSPLPSSILLVDDVFTTGATLCAATDALQAAGVGEVRCTTFARVW
ncbi:MAG: phosphoribosyltransferase family protein [Raoultibacter sp.]